MNWEIVGVIAEIIGSVAVVITLAYLARQTHTNTSFLRSQAERSAWLSFGDMNMQIASDADLARIWLKSLDAGMSDWDEVDWVRFQTFARSEANKMYDIHRQLKHGFFQKEEANGLLDYLRGLLEYPAWRIWWEDEKRIRAFAPGFIQSIESRAPSPVGMTRLDEIRRITASSRAAAETNRQEGMDKGG